MLLPTHLQYGLFALLLATQFQGTVTNPFTVWAICIAVGNPIPVPSCLVCCYQPIYTIWWNLGYPGHCYQPIYNMGYLHCCWQPNACARLFSVLLPAHLHYLVKSKLSRVLLPTQFTKWAICTADGYPEYCCQAIYTTKGIPGPNRGAFFQFSFRYIYYCETQSFLNLVEHSHFSI